MKPTEMPVTRPTANSIWRSFQTSGKKHLVLTGASGSGKTTILNLVNGLDRPTSGEVLYDGKNIYDMNDDELADMRLRHMGTVFQAYNLIPELSVYENVVLPIKIAKRKANMQKVDYLLEQLGLIDRKNFMPDQLSGGQQQRVAIARAMINDPEILFCDEPTGNLDKKTGDEVMDILKMLNEEMGISIMVITHDQSVADRCKKIMHLSDGKLVTSGN